MPRQHSSLVRVLFLSTFICLSAPLLTGCDDPDSVSWEIKHLSDAKRAVREDAISKLVNNWHTIKQMPEVDTEHPEKNDSLKADKAKMIKEFIDQTIQPIIDAYVSDALKDDAKRRQVLLDLLQDMPDARSKPALVFAISHNNWKDTDANDRQIETKKAIHMVINLKESFAGDADIGKALVTILKVFKPSEARSFELPILAADALSAIKPKVVVADLLEILKKPNGGDMTMENKDTTAQQTFAAQVIGDVAAGDTSVASQLVSILYEDAPKTAKMKDQSGEEITDLSPLTSGVAQVIGSALAKFGTDAQKILMPYVKDDTSVKAVADIKAVFGKLKEKLGNNTKEHLYIDIATSIVVNIGSPATAAEVIPIVTDKSKKESERKPLLILLIKLPPTPDTIAAVKTGYSLASDEFKKELAGGMATIMSPDIGDWLVDLASDAKADSSLKKAALSQALLLASPATLVKIRDAMKAAKIMDTKDDLYSTKVVNKDPGCKANCEKPCTANDKLPAGITCEDGPDATKVDKDNKPLKFQWIDLAPTYEQELSAIEGFVKDCGNGSCAVKKVADSVKSLNKIFDGAPPTKESILSQIVVQKAIWNVALVGTEDDLVSLAQVVPNLRYEIIRRYIAMALEKNIKGGDKLIKAIQGIEKDEHEKLSETANRETMLFDPVVNKIRVRVSSKK